MMGPRPAVWGLPAPRSASYKLAVIADDASLAERAAQALERDGLQVHLEANGPGPETLDETERRPTLVIVRCSHDRRLLERVLRYARQRAPGAVVIVVIAAGDHVDVRLTLSSGADALVR